jgi:translation initiation factor 4A
MSESCIDESDKKMSPVNTLEEGKDQCSKTLVHTDHEQEIYPTVDSWDQLNLPVDLLRGIYAYGFESPSDIQKKAILPIISGRDTIAQAQSGSGKTGAFSIATLHKIDLTKNVVQAIIIVPTHELAKQIQGVITSIGSFLDKLRVKLIIGGTSIQQDAAELRNSPPHIIVGCAGRIYDMVVRKHLNLSTIKLVVLDEADEMLSKGFKDQIYNIFQQFSPEIQVALFSATLPDEILNLTRRFMINSVKIVMKKEDISVAGIKQYFVALNDDRSKYETLKGLFSMISVSQCIIYCNSVKRVVDLHRAMTDEGFSVCCIHSNMNKIERDAAFQSFKTGAFRVLISSDITARGIDVQQVQVVVNFDVCKDVSTYIHRVGRSGRFGRIGCAINFITRKDVFYMKKIENYYKINIEELPGDFKGV